MKNTFFEDNNIDIIEAYSKLLLELCFNAGYVIKYLLYFVIDIILIVLYPLIFPITLLVCYCMYPSQKEKTNKAIEEHINRMFPNKDKNNE